MKVLIINGPNLDKLGFREPNTYGKETYKDLVNKIEEAGKRLDIVIEIVQYNSEGDIISRINKYDYDGLIINPGAYSHYSYAIYDCLKMNDKTKYEIHISNVHQREEFRSHLVTARGTNGVISGFGTQGYVIALEHIVSNFRNNE
jgi:3-dehydroquinate dehydratase-2